jgi:hypothetical protein
VLSSRKTNSGETTQRPDDIHFCLAPMRTRTLLLLSAQHRPGAMHTRSTHLACPFITGPPTYPKAERPDEDDELVVLYLSDSKLTSDNTFSNLVKRLTFSPFGPI